MHKKIYFKRLEIGIKFKTESGKNRTPVLYFRTETGNIILKKTVFFLKIFDILNILESLLHTKDDSTRFRDSS